MLKTNTKNPKINTSQRNIECKIKIVEYILIPLLRRKIQPRIEFINQLNKQSSNLCQKNEFEATLKKHINFGFRKKMEREMGLEPTTFSLEG